MKLLMEGPRQVRLLILCCCWPLMAGVSLAAEMARKNVVIIVADDLGMQLGCYGDRFSRTPNIDKLAEHGVRCTRAYCTTASCSPSRSVLLTGMHNHGNGQLGLAHSVHHFAGYESLQTLPALMKSAGYRTCRIGKFHVAPEYAYPFEFARNEGIQGARNSVRMAENARDWIRENDARPFLLYYCSTDPHRGPGPADYANQTEKPDFYPGLHPEIFDPAFVPVPEWLPDRPEIRQDLAEYYQSIARLDTGVGVLTQALRDTGHADDTLILFLSDNGPPFPGAKTTLYEPGIHLPLIVADPGCQRHGTCDALITWADLLPTILESCGVQPPVAPALLPLENQGRSTAGDDAKNPRKNKSLYQFHGRSFVKALAEEHPADWQETFYSHTFHEVTMYYPMRAVRSGKYKLIWNIAHPLSFPFAQDLYQSLTWQTILKQKKSDDLYGVRTVQSYEHRPAFELFDLDADPSEKTNLADRPEHAETLAKLQEKLHRFQTKTGDPWDLKWEHE